MPLVNLCLTKPYVQALVLGLLGYSVKILYRPALAAERDTSVILVTKQPVKPKTGQDQPAPRLPISWAQTWEQT